MLIMAEIDYQSEVHVYRQIAAWVEDYITRQHLQPGQPIPSEKTLGQEFPGVARSTIRRAVAYLRDQGVVHTVPQKGTYVGPEPHREP